MSVIAARGGVSLLSCLRNSSVSRRPCSWNVPGNSSTFNKQRSPSMTRNIQTAICGYPPYRLATQNRHVSPPRQTCFVTRVGCWSFGVSVCVCMNAAYKTTPALRQSHSSIYTDIKLTEHNASKLVINALVLLNANTIVLCFL